MKPLSARTGRMLLAFMVGAVLTVLAYTAGELAVVVVLPAWAAPAPGAAAPGPADAGHVSATQLRGAPAATLMPTPQPSGGERRGSGAVTQPRSAAATASQAVTKVRGSLSTVSDGRSSRSTPAAHAPAPRVKRAKRARPKRRRAPRGLVRPDLATATALVAAMKQRGELTWAHPPRAHYPRYHASITLASLRAARAGGRTYASLPPLRFYCYGEKVYCTREQAVAYHVLTSVLGLRFIATGHAKSADVLAGSLLHYAPKRSRRTVASLYGDNQRALRIFWHRECCDGEGGVRYSTLGRLQA
jgi:hypothetical protein